MLRFPTVVMVSLGVGCFLTAIPAHASAQDIFFCRDCNNLTKQCETEPISGELDEICTQGDTGGGWCHSHGGTGVECDIQVAQLDADGLVPRMLEVGRVVAKANVLEERYLKRDCLNRIREVAFTAAEGQSLRSKSGEIVI